jgi:hypothetical protein
METLMNLRTVTAFYVSSIPFYKTIFFSVSFEVLTAVVMKRAED